MEERNLSVLDNQSGKTQETKEESIVPVLGNVQADETTGTKTLPSKIEVKESNIVSSGVLNRGEPSVVDSGTGGRTNNYYAETAPLVSSWESGAEKQAGLKFQQDVLAGKQTMVKSAQELQAQGQAGQTQLALGEYMRGQSAEKAGWTGGYMLDQKRQGDYLRASIQAQMYGAQELQKYGMDTQLEAARLAYDLGKDQLAYQMYQEAQQLAITEAQMFGYYVSPEIRDMMNQLSAAQTALLDNPEDERAINVKNTIEDWFGREGIDPNDLSTFGRLTMEREQYNQAKLDAVLASIGDDPSVFIARNSNGTYQTDPATGQYVKLNFQDVNKEDLFKFLGVDDQAQFKFSDAAFKSYARYLGQSTINAYFNSLSEDETPTSEGFQAYLETEENDRLNEYLNGLELSKDESDLIKQILGDNFEASLTKGGVTITYGSAKKESVQEEEKEEETIIEEENPWNILNDFKNPVSKEAMTWEDYNNKYNDYYGATGGTKANAVEMATMYKEDYDFFTKTSKNSFTNLDFTQWALRFQRAHNTFSDKSYKDYVYDVVADYIEKQTGAKGTRVDYDVMRTKNQEIIYVPLSNVTQSMETKLLSLGFKKTNAGYELNYENAGIITNNKNLINNYKLPTYKDGSGWRDRYEKTMQGNTALRLLYYMQKIDLSTTVEGESRWS